MTNHNSQKMSSHGRGRGLRRNFEGGGERPGGLKSRGDKYSPELTRPSDEDNQVCVVCSHMFSQFLVLYWF